LDAGWSIENIVFIVRPEGLELLTFWFEASRAHRALATVKPNCAGDSANKIRSECLVPAMTAVSKPNSNPPRAPTRMPRTWRRNCRTV